MKYLKPLYKKGFKAMNFNEFELHYNNWKEESKEELRRKGYLNKIINNCDICEDGSVYFVNLYYTPKDFVTRWENSKHYCK